MKTYIGRHQAVTETDYFELALGTPLELWLGQGAEGDEERAARLDAARDILDTDPGFYARALRATAETFDRRPALAVVPGGARSVRAARDVARTAVAA